MRDLKPIGNMLWAVLFCFAATFGFNGCGDVNDVFVPNDAPVANAGPDLGSIPPGTQITLNGSSSTDPDGNPLTYSWKLLSKPAGSPAVLANPTSVTPRFTVDRSGDYIAQLIVHDGTVSSAPDTVLISTNNVPPVADAGPNQGGMAPGSLITLDGSGSSDGNADPLTYLWSLTTPAGSAAALDDPTSVMPTFTVDRAGNYIAQLIVHDGTVNSAPDTVLISTSNVPPVADAGPDQGGKAPGSLITLDGSGSSDANGDPLTYSWSLISKPPGSTAVLSSFTNVSTTFTVDRAGNYIAQLIVSDGTVNSAPDTVLISTSNVPPVADAGPDQGGKAPGSLVTLDGSGSSDANGDPLTYSWSLSKPAGSAAVLSSTTNVSPTFTVDLAGSYTAQLIVNDGAASSLPNSVIITTNNVAPVANAGPDQGGKAPGSLVTLDGSGSSDANGDPLTYSWSLSKPAGSAAVLSSTTNVSPTFTVDLAGSYTAQLIVNDGAASSLPDTVIITTNNIAPVANAGPDQGGMAPGSLITLDGSGSSDGNGDPLTYSWSLSTPPGSAAVLSSTTNVSTTFTVDRAGAYVVQLIVNDGTVDSLPDSVTITSVNVAPGANAGPDQPGVVPLSLITLDGSGSSDANGDPLTYSWSFTNKPALSLAVLLDPTSVSPTFILDLPGDYVVELIVNDGTVNSASDSVTITSP